jgi:hypothetical protein
MLSNLVGPYRHSSCGRFKIGFFELEKVVDVGEFATAEDVASEFRVCIEYSGFDQASGKIVHHRIWCSPKELFHLQKALRLV